MMTRPVVLSAVVLSATAMVGCIDLAPPAEKEAPLEKVPPVKVSEPLPTGSYDDADGAYRLFLVGAPVRGAFTTTELRLARLSDEEKEAGKGARLDVGQGAAITAEEGVEPSADPVAVLPADFAIQYTHNAVEEHNGQTVIVRQEHSTWSPFMSMMTGMAVGNMLFGPRYYYPPPYAGGALAGAGAVGATKSQATQAFTSQHGKAPQSTRLSTSGYSKKPSSSFKSTGKGAGATKLKTSGQRPVKPRGGFGGRGFGRRR